MPRSIVVACAMLVVSAARAEPIPGCQAMVDALTESHDESSVITEEVAALRTSTIGTPSAGTRSMVLQLDGMLVKARRFQREQIGQLLSKGCIDEARADSYIKQMDKTEETERSFIRRFLG